MRNLNCVVRDKEIFQKQENLLNEKSLPYHYSSGFELHKEKNYIPKEM